MTGLCQRVPSSRVSFALTVLIASCGTRHSPMPQELTAGDGQGGVSGVGGGAIEQGGDGVVGGNDGGNLDAV